MTVFSPTRNRPIALVTGASAGLGAQFARALARRGHDLILVARRRERLEALAAELATDGAAAEVLPADLTNDADLLRVEERIRRCENLAMLVNNAGFGLDVLFHESDLAGQSAMARLHVLAPTHLTHAALPGMVRRGRGAVINVSSVAAWLQGASGVMYCATKAFLNSFTLSLAVELAGTGVRVQALCPGFTYTEFHDVLGMDRDLVPKFWWLRADYVVEQSLRGLRRGKVVCIPSLRYKLLAAVFRAMPQWLMSHIGQKRYKALQARREKAK
ncbi:MAG: SDR family oxidoreductase [Phycisphaerae bacterium]|nr:SDR family oxidoreductase [Phycisphaerae bacterium]